MRIVVVKKLKILPKMLIGIILPVVLLLVVASVVILNTVGKSVTELSTRSLTSESKAVANQTREFFNSYLGISKQSSTNYEVEVLLKKTQKGIRLNDVEGFSNIKRTLENIVATDSENILSSWVCDFDSSQYSQSDGIVSDADWDVTTRPLYAVMQTKVPFLTEPYVDSASSNTIISMVSPVFDSSSKEIIGVTAIDIKIDQLNSILGQYKIGETGFIILSTGTGIITYSPKAEDIQKSVTETGLSKNAINAIQNKTLGTLTYTMDGKKITGNLTAVGDTGWTILTGLPQAELEKTNKAVAKTILSILLIVLPIMILVILLIARGIVKPLKKLSIVANSIAEGDLDVMVNLDSSDEVGQVSSAIGKTVGRLKEYINYIDEVSDVLDKIAQGNLVFELRYDYFGEFSKIKNSLLNIQSTLSEALMDISESSEQVANGSDQVASGAQALSQSTTEQAATIEELSATINEIYKKINKNASDSQTANRLTSASSEKLIAGNQEMKKMLTAMEDIGVASKKIENINRTIDDIAFQTNILALNAAVEAARAGAAGKGFAVVADEVRNLASKSAQAAKDTTQLIQDAISAVERGTKIADGTAITLAEVIESSNQAAGIVNAITVSTTEQAASIAQITQGIDQISDVVQTNSATAEESAATSEELSGQAASLQSAVRKFKLK